MAALEVGMLAPGFESEDHKGNPVKLQDFHHKQPVVLVFFPKDDTPGCTKQLCGLRDHDQAMSEAGIALFAISFESADEHQNFATKYSLPMPFLMDMDQRIGKAYGVAKEYKPGTFFPERKTFVINREGIISGIIHEASIDFENHWQQIQEILQKST